MKMCRWRRDERHLVSPWEDVIQAGLYDGPAALFSEKRDLKTFY